MIEYFVHIDPSDPPRDLVVVAADVPDHLSRTTVPLKRLPDDWRRTPAPASLAAIGDSFAAGRKAAILIVPSALVPSESNWLVNPGHAGARAIRVQPPEPFRYDERFFA
jgi:RES domain-containing protein